MNAGSVITNLATEEKLSWGSPAAFPKFSILNPAYTVTVPKNHTVYGIVDMMSHVFEQYFHNTTNTPITDEMCEGVLRTVITTAPKLLEDLENTKLRETILLAGTIGLNGFLSIGSRGIGHLIILNMQCLLYMTFHMRWFSHSSTALDAFKCTSKS